MGELCECGECEFERGLGLSLLYSLFLMVISVPVVLSICSVCTTPHSVPQGPFMDHLQQ